jgi:hypothetical protein
MNRRQSAPGSRLVHDVVVHQCEQMQQLERGAGPDDVGPADVAIRPSAAEPAEVDHDRPQPFAAAADHGGDEFRNVGCPEDFQRTVVVVRQRGPDLAEFVDDLAEQCVDEGQVLIDVGLGRRHRNQSARVLELGLAAVPGENRTAVPGEGRAGGYLSGTHDDPPVRSRFGPAGPSFAIACTCCTAHGLKANGVEAIADTTSSQSAQAQSHTSAGFGRIRLEFGPATVSGCTSCPANTGQISFSQIPVTSRVR